MQQQVRPAAAPAARVVQGTPARQAYGGNRWMDDYKPVVERIKEFRAEHPNWSIITEIVEYGPDYAIFRAQIVTDSGTIVSTGTKRVTADRNPQFIESAETGAVGRALMMLGYDVRETEEEEQPQE